MAKRRYAMDEQKIARFCKQGRGTGTGADYKPWLTIQDVPSNGLSSRVPSLKSPRLHHCLSNEESKACHLYAWADHVTDIREQFPLDRELTREIAAQMKIQHPRDTETKVDIVMTTDFLINLNVGQSEKVIARSIKLAKDLEDQRTLEKQEIERRYWEIKGEEWGLITERQLPEVRCQNLRWMFEMVTFEHQKTPYDGYWQDKCARFMAHLQSAHNITLRQFYRQLENKLGFASGEGISVLRHLAANKVIGFDLDQPYDYNADISIITVATAQHDSSNLRIA